MNSLEFLFKPRKIAVVGASQRGGRGAQVLKNLVALGFDGDIFAVNPGYDEVLGHKCFPSIPDLPASPECVVVAIGADNVCDVLEQAYARGTRAAVVLSGGFGEGGHGEARAQRLRDLAAGGMAICGPNCHGILNLKGNVAAYGGETPHPPKCGPVALISQSGGLARNAFIPLMVNRSLGFSYVVSCGNQIGVSIEDYIEYFVDDDDVTTIAAHVESLKNPEKLRAVALEAHRKGKTLIMFQTGRSAVGRAMVRSHTGALVSDSNAFAAFLRRCGVVQIESYEEFVECIELFANAPLDDKIGDDVVVISGSGGGAAIAADVLDQAGIPLARLHESTRDRIGAALPQFGSVSNPIDATGSVYSDMTLLPKLFDAVLADPGNPVVAAALPVPRYQMVRFAEVIAESARTTGRTTVAYQMSSLGERLYPEVVETLHAASVPIIQGVSNAMRCLRYLPRRRDLRLAALARSDVRSTPFESSARPEFDAAGGFIAARDALMSYGVAVVPACFVSSEDEAVLAFRSLGGAVAVKAETPGLAHKSDIGGVRLNCGSETEVREAYRAVLASVAAALGTPPRGAIVQKMVAGIAEVYAGVINDESYGPVVTFGLGGIFIEVRPDVTMESAPLSHADAQRMICGIKAFPVLDGARGRPKGDIAALADLLVGLSEFASANAGRFRALDLNPIIVGKSGDGVLAVDIAIETR